MFPSSLRLALAAVAATAALALLAPIEAEARGHKPQHWHRGGPPAFVPPGHARRYAPPAPVYVVPAPVYVAPPPPVYVVPAPVYLEPVYPHPYPRGGSASFSITIPLD